MIIADYEEKGNGDANKYSYDLDSNANRNSVAVPISEIYFSNEYCVDRFDNLGCCKTPNAHYGCPCCDELFSIWGSCRKHMEVCCPQQLYFPKGLQQRCADIFLNSQSAFDVPFNSQHPDNYNKGIGKVREGRFSTTKIETFSNERTTYNWNSSKTYISDNPWEVQQVHTPVQAPVVQAPVVQPAVKDDEDEGITLCSKPYHYIWDSDRKFVPFH